MTVILSDEITPMEENNFRLSARDAADQVDASSEAAHNRLDKYKRMVDAILAPTFINGSDYPFDWTNVVPKTFDELPEWQK